MKPYQLIILIFFCLFLTGCSHTGSGSGPLGQSGNRPINQNTSPNCAVITDNRQRKQCEDQKNNAAKGRDVPPTDNSSCTQSKTGGKCCDFPAWLTEAYKFIGLHEGGNGKPNDIGVVTIDYTQKGKEKGYLPDGQSIQVDLFHKSVPWERGKIRTFDRAGAWCGSFVQWCLTKTNNPKTKLPYEGLPGISGISSKAWRNYGVTINKSKPCLGAIMVISSGHVTFLVGILEQTIKLKNGKTQIKRSYLGLGGNQGDKVKISPYSFEAVEKIVLPKDYNPCKESENLTDTWWVREYKRNPNPDNYNETIH